MHDLEALAKKLTACPEGHASVSEARKRRREGGNDRGGVGRGFGEGRRGQIQVRGQKVGRAGGWVDAIEATCMRVNG